MTHFAKEEWDSYNNANVRRHDETKTQLDEMKRMLAEMKNKMEELQINNNNNNKLKKPPCPICFEEMSNNTKIAQCINGHHMRSYCKKKMMKNDCPSCGQPVDGRAFGMESYLMSLFPKFRFVIKAMIITFTRKFSIFII